MTSLGLSTPAATQKRAQQQFTSRYTLWEAPHDAGGIKSFSRDNIITIPKILAEVKPYEWKMILGWIVDTRQFTVAYKRKAWDKAVNRLLASRLAHITTKDLETTLRRLSGDSWDDSTKPARGQSTVGRQG